MTFRDLQEAIARLASDPRVHPNTRVDLQVHSFSEHPELQAVTRPLCHVVVNGHVLLATTKAEPAMAR